MEYFFYARDGTRLVARSWEADNPRGVLLVVHGLGEYGSKYVSMAQELTRSGYTLCALDLRGFGFSEGRRGHASSFETLCDDLETFLFTTKTYYEKPFFLLGQSMGATLISYAACIRSLDVEGIILSSPWIGDSSYSEKIKWKLVNNLGAVVPSVRFEFDARKIESGKKSAPLSAYADRNHHLKVSAGLFREARRAARFLYSCTSSLNIPLLGIHGEKDRVTYAENTRKFVKSQGGSFYLWPAQGHFLHRGSTRKDFCRKIVKWMDEHNRF